MAEAITEPSNENLISFEDVPISALQQKTRQILSNYFRSIKLFPSESGHFRDWRGIFHLSGLDNHDWDFLKNNSEPFIKLIDIWSKHKTCDANFAKLQMIFGLIDRWDVFDDTKTMLEQDAIIYQKCITKHSKPIVKLETEENILTTDDVENACLQYYDAFILYAEEDYVFAKTVIDFAESIGLKVFVKDRDLLAGISFEHDAIRRLLTDRCNRLVVILSKSFIQSPADKFITKVAQRIGMEQENRKIVPIIIEEHFEVPALFNVYFKLSYPRTMRFNTFWKNLEKSLIVGKNINNTASKEVVTSTSSTTSTPSLTPTTIESTPSPLERPQSTNNENSLETISSGSLNSGAIKKSGQKLKIKFWKKKKTVSKSTSNVETSDNTKNEQIKLKKESKKEKIFS